MLGALLIHHPRELRIHMVSHLLFGMRECHLERIHNLQITIAYHSALALACPGNGLVDVGHAHVLNELFSDGKELQELLRQLGYTLHLEELLVAMVALQGLRDTPLHTV